LSAFLNEEPVKVGQVTPRGIPIGQSLPRRILEDPFGAVAFSSELIFEKIPESPAHHCSTIAEAANGDLLVVWYGGSFESADDQALFLSRRKKGERVWGQPEVLLRDSAQPPGNAVVFRAGTNRLCIVWARMEASRPLRRGGGWGETRLWYRTSEDHGVTWSKDEPFLGGVREGLRNVPITLISGELLLPLGQSFARTKDRAGLGNSWARLPARATDCDRAFGWLVAHAFAQRPAHHADRIARWRPNLERCFADPPEESRSGHRDDPPAQWAILYWFSTTAKLTARR